jgi:hypothetical protein
MPFLFVDMKTGLWPFLLIQPVTYQRRQNVAALAGRMHGTLHICTITDGGRTHDLKKTRGRKDELPKDDYWAKECDVLCDRRMLRGAYDPFIL